MGVSMYVIADAGKREFEYRPAFPLFLILPDSEV